MSWSCRASAPPHAAAITSHTAHRAKRLLISARLGFVGDIAQKGTAGSNMGCGVAGGVPGEGEGGARSGGSSILIPMIEERHAGQEEQFSPIAALSAVIALASAGACLLSFILSMAVDPMLGAIALPLPLLSLGAVVLSALALRAIGRSEGRVKGRKLALIGLFLGLMLAVIQGAMSGAALASYLPIRRKIVPLAQEVAAAVSRGDLPAARSSMAPAVSQVLSDDRISGFFTGLEASQGDFVRAEFSIDSWIRSRGRIVSAMGGRSTPATQPSEFPKPVELVYARGRLNAYFFIDEAGLGRQEVLLRDVLVFVNDSSLMVLLPDGPASLWARWFGLPIVQP